MPKHLPPRWFFVLVSFAAGALCCVQFYGNTFLHGWDAYYYLLKTAAWFEHHQWAVADGNFVHLLLSPFKWLGFSPQQTWQLWPGVSIICFLLSFYKNIRFIKNPVWATVIFAWAVLSPSLFYSAVNFPKTFLALICFNFVFFYTLTKRPIPWCLFACATILLHKIMLPYVGLCALWFYWQNRQKDTTLIGCAIGALGLFWLLLQQTATFSINLTDLTRLESGNLTPGILYLIGRTALPSGLRLELVTSLLLGIAMLWRYPKQLRYMALGWLFALLPVGSAETFGLGERTALLLPYMIMLSCVWLAYTLPNVKQKPIRWHRWLYTAGALLLVAFFRPSYALPSTHQEDEQNLLLVSSLRSYRPALLITNRRFSYFYKFHTGLESFPFEPDDDWDKTAIWRLVSGATPQALQPFLPAHCQEYMHEILLPNGFSSGNTLLREDCYVALRAAVAPNVIPLYPLLHTNTINPWKPRPDFLRKKSPIQYHFSAR